MAPSRDHRRVHQRLWSRSGGEEERSRTRRRRCRLAHRILPLILTAAARLALDALPPQRLDAHRELGGELETGRVAWKQIGTHTKHAVSSPGLVTDSYDPLVSLQKERGVGVGVGGADAESDPAPPGAFKPA